MPKVANYFVRPEGVALSLATVKDVQYGECIDKLKQAGVGGGVVTSHVRFSPLPTSAFPPHSTTTSLARPLCRSNWKGMSP